MNLRVVLISFSLIAYFTANTCAQEMIFATKKQQLSIEADQIMVFDTTASLSWQEVYNKRKIFFKKIKSTPVYPANFDAHWALLKVTSEINTRLVLDFQQVFIEAVDFYLV